MIDRAKQLWFTVRHIGALLWQADKRLLIIQTLINIFISISLIPTLKLDSIVLDKIISSVGTDNIQAALWSIGYIVALRFTITLVVAFFQRLSNALNRLLSLKFRNLLEQQLGKQFSSLDVELVESPQFKDRYQRIEREGIDRSFTLVSSFTDISNYLAGMISALSLFIFIQPLIVVFTIILLIPIMVVDSRLIKKSYETEKMLADAYRGRGMVGYYLIRAKSYLELRLLGISNFLLKKLTGYQTELLNKRIEREKERVGLRFLANLPEDIFSSSLNIYFAYLAIIKTITVGTAQIFVRATGTFKDNLSGLIGAVLQFYENYLYVSDVVWYLNLKPKKDPTIGKLFPQKINQSIRFDHIWFKYPDVENWTLTDVSFEIKSKENIAIVGENGAGKTTLIKLLAGFYTPTKGEITIDGIPINAYRQDEYWKKLSIFFQEYETYDFNAQETIGYGNVSKLNDAPEIQKYAQMTGIDEWVNTLPNKYQHPLSRSYEKGVSPSTGQWQRLALTRSLIKDAQIVVLDEPTSNVDPKAEEDIFTEVLRHGKDKILIFISHRFSTVRRADKIVVLDHGTVKEYGSHQQLLKQKGLYAKLFTLQAKSYQ